MDAVNINLSYTQLERLCDLAWKSAHALEDINERVEAKRVCRKFAMEISQSKASRWRVNL